MPTFIDEEGHEIYQGRGQVIGEFVCDRIYNYSTSNIDGQDISGEDMQKQSCLSKEELKKYEYSAEPKEGSVYLIGLYGWHISELKIYDKPKELINFTGLRKTKFGYEPVKVIRAPQSWCYVEELETERKCRICGCTWNNACAGGCYWVEENLCSACVEDK